MSIRGDRRPGRRVVEPVDGQRPGVGCDGPAQPGPYDTHKAQVSLNIVSEEIAHRSHASATPTIHLDRVSMTFQQES